MFLSLLLYLEGENKLVKSNKLLPFNIKSISPIQKYSHLIVCLYSLFICCDIFISNYFFYFL